MKLSRFSDPQLNVIVFTLCLFYFSLSLLSVGVEVVGDIKEGWERILSPDAVQFLADVHRNFEAKRQSVLQSRIDRQKLIDQGQDLKVWYFCLLNFVSSFTLN